MTEHDMNEFEPTRDDDTDSPVDPVDAPADENESPSETTDSEDPTLRLMASEYAIFGLSRHAGHAYTGHVHGDD